MAGMADNDGSEYASLGTSPRERIWRFIAQRGSTSERAAHARFIVALDLLDSALALGHLLGCSGSHESDEYTRDLAAILAEKRAFADEMMALWWKHNPDPSGEIASRDS